MSPTSTSRSIATNPYVLLTLTALFWSGNMVLARAINVATGANTPIPPLMLALGRWLIVLALTTPWAWQHRHYARALLAGWKTLLVLALTGITAYNSFAYIALQYTTATNAVLLNSFIPIMTVLLGWLFLRRPVSGLQALGVLVSFLGVMMIVLQGQLSHLLTLSINRGDLWMLMAVVDWAIYTLALQWHPKVPPMLLLWSITAVGLLALAPFALLDLSQQPPLQWSLINGLSVAYVGIFPGFLGYVFYNRGIREVGAPRGSLFIHLMPVFGALLSFIFLGEQLHGYHLLGMAGIFMGIGLNLWKR